MLRLALLAAVVALSAPAALAHEWFSRQCCSDKDCMVIPPEAVRWTDDGWVIVATGEVIPHGDPRIHDTPPEGGGQYGWCRRLADSGPTVQPYVRPFKAGDTICLYVPPGGV